MELTGDVEVSCIRIVANNAVFKDKGAFVWTHL